VAVLTVGSDLRGDDGAGLLVGAAMDRWLRKRAGGASEWAVFNGHTAPENLTGEIKRFNPTHLVIVDAADFGAQPGDTRLIDPWQTDGPMFGTHKMPPNVLVEYLRQTVQCDIVIVAMQHGGLEFGARPSAEIRRAVRRVTAALRGAARPETSARHMT
jgi:hydrogenase 3 maturation protease